jgi:branched-chain amino acid transport system substrate-binding protein
MEVRAAGGQNVANARYRQGATQFTPLIASLTRLHPSVVLVSADWTSGVAFVKALRVSGLQTPVIGGIDWDPIATSASAGLGEVFLAVLFSPTNPSSRDFTVAFRDSFAVEPDVYSALGYDGMRLLSNAVAESETGNITARLIASDASTAELAMGGFRFGSDRTPVGKKIAIVEVGQGAVSFVDEVVAP